MNSSSSQLISVHEGYLASAETPTYSGFNSFHLSNTPVPSSNNGNSTVGSIHVKKGAQKWPLRMHCILLLADASYHPFIWYGTTQPLNTSTQTDRKWGEWDALMLPHERQVIMQLRYQSWDITCHPEGNERWVRKSFSAHTTIYKSKENTARASHLICHPERQVNIQENHFITRMCQLSLKPHARLHTQDWQRGLLLAPGSGPLVIDTRWIHKNKTIPERPSEGQPGLPPQPGFWVIPSHLHF